jgi:hypothetical protein
MQNVKGNAVACLPVRNEVKAGLPAGLSAEAFAQAEASAKAGLYQETPVEKSTGVFCFNTF